MDAPAITRRQIEPLFQAVAAPSIRWTVHGATVSTALNQPYVIRLTIESDQRGADPLELLGSSATLVLRRDLGDASGADDLAENVYGGIVSSIRVEPSIGRRETIRASLVLEPALAGLRHGRDSRIFQEQTVPEILRDVLSSALSPYGREVQLEVQREYPAREYTVQYQESDFDFVHRLMEEEGIVYYFTPGDDGVETLVLMDAPQQHPPIEGGPILEYAVVTGGWGVLTEEHVGRFEPVSTVVGTEIATRHFDWTHPAVLIEGQAAGTPEGDIPDGAASGPARESYEHDEPLTMHRYELAYRAYDVADQQRLRRERQAREARTFQATSSVSAIRAGVRFELNGHPSVALNAEYVVTSVVHRVGGHMDHEAGDGEDMPVNYENTFVAVPADVPYRPVRVRPRPRVHGIQTAIVTGPPGEEIHTDEHGRVKVQFPWDRRGRMDDHTTCWIRCMQSWSGHGFGAWILPRVGMEVVVSFIDGDLDRPFVTGCAFNGDNVTPYELPAKKMVSTFKTNSYPGGDGYNELRFDDTKSAEEIWMHGEKDWNTVIEHDLDREVRHDERQRVLHDRTRNVGNNETLVVGANRLRMVGLNESVAVVVNQDTKVGANRTVDVGLNQVFTAGETFEIRCGKSRIFMNKDGVVVIEGTEFHFGASGPVRVIGEVIDLN
ncbi:MAG: type VI secretion system Vgr family protein [Sandaracinaceae bacterium]